MNILMLPYPPSVNRLWRFAGGRMYRSKVYNDWAVEAERHIVHQPRVPIFTVPVFLELAVGRPDKRRRDLDNVNKAILDILQHLEVLEDDSLVHHLCSFWDEETVGVRAIIRPIERKYV